MDNGYEWRGYRSTEVQKYKSTDVQKYRCTDVQMYRSTEKNVAIERMVAVGLTQRDPYLYY
jgi:hypothetical protein